MIKDYQSDLLTRLCSILELWKRTAIYHIVYTHGFEKFENSRQLISYFGINPIIHESGSSVRGKSRISKSGYNHGKNLLFMCAFTACAHFYWNLHTRYQYTWKISTTIVLWHSFPIYMDLSPNDNFFQNTFK